MRLSLVAISVLLLITGCGDDESATATAIAQCKAACERQGEFPDCSDFASWCVDQCDAVVPAMTAECQTKGEELWTCLATTATVACDAGTPTSSGCETEHDEFSNAGCSSPAL